MLNFLQNIVIEYVSKGTTTLNSTTFEELFIVNKCSPPERILWTLFVAIKVTTIFGYLSGNLI